ncbi:hypothetical protein Dimus_000379 [Dionaea muscipula]
MENNSRYSLITFLLLQLLNCIPLSTTANHHHHHLATPPPLPILPLPNYAQLKWQQREIIMFLHFGVNTFTDSEWGTGQESPSIFNPTRLDTGQWVDVAVEAGISLMILTAKHHDGFCLWPSIYTDHSVVGSPWKGGHGDVVREFVDAAKARGVDAALYLSPWDRHDKRYGHEKAYNEYYLAQLQELLSKYGSIREIWFDGAKGPNAPNMSYYFGDWFATVRELQSSINIFSDAGPDVRWVGNEKGFAGTTCWSSINRTLLSIGNASIENYLNTGDSRGTDWVPPECDVSIREGWFWHRSQQPKNLTQLLELYFNSVGHNCLLLLNVPPDTTGLISEADAKRLKELRVALDTIFSRNLAENCSVQVSSQRAAAAAAGKGGGGGFGFGFGPENMFDSNHLWTYWVPDEHDKRGQWVEIRGISQQLRFNVIKIQEAIGLGQRIEQHEIYVDERLVAAGTTVGHKRLHRLEEGVVEGHSVRILIVRSRGLPLISSVGLYLDPFWHPE